MSQIAAAIKDLEAQRARIEAAIRTLKGLAGGAAAGGKKRTLSAEGRQRIVEAQKKRWAAARKAKK